MIGELIVVIMALLFFLFAIILFLGKGKNLIAGYNALSEDERKRYNEKKVCRGAGVLCLVCCAVLLVLAYMINAADRGALGEKQLVIFAIFFLVVIILAIAAVGIYMDKKAKNK